MNGAQTYLEHMRHNAVRRTAVLFMLYTLTSSLFCGLAYSVFLQWSTGTVWRITPYTGSGFVSAVLSQSWTVLFLAVRFLAAFTVFSRGVSVLFAALRGAGLGCAAAFIARGLLNLPSGGWMYANLASALALLFYCALADVYADGFLTLSGMHERRMRASLFTEFLKLTGVLSGVILLSGIVSAILIS
ncbi:MAG: hypothetical protein IJ497_04480 [Clostridia bacterium]|nr:hypothetical protein [Clostridia bacterium]MBQ8511850.1 hypothetical protein [Clostridia bacterium]